MDVSFLGKSALITGASQGVAIAIISKLLRCGMRIVAVDADNLDALKLKFPDILTVIADISKWNQIELALISVGPIDFLINNPITNKKNIDLIDYNTKGMINVTQVIVRDLLVRKSGGAIINLANRFIASATIDSFTSNLAVELEPHRIRVNSVNLEHFNYESVDQIVDVVVFLLSEQSKDVSGSSFPVILDESSSSNDDDDDE